MLEIDKCAATPKLLVKFIPADRAAGVIEEQGKNLQGLSLKPYPDTVLPQFPDVSSKVNGPNVRCRERFALGSPLTRSPPVKVSAMRCIRKFLEFRGFRREVFWSEF